MYKALLVRSREQSDDKKTVGRFLLFNENGEIKRDRACLELPWKENSPDESCIPEGEYEVKAKKSKKFGDLAFEIQDVPGRTDILMHVGNFTRESRGCQFLGWHFVDIDGDGITDVANSEKTMKDLRSLADKFTYKIIWL